MNLEPTWTDARIGALKDARTAGLSAAQIAAQIGVTRNAVIGKLHRLGIMGKKPAYVPRPPKPKVERRAPPSQRRLRIHTGGGRAFRGEVEIVQDVDLVDLPPDQSDFACTIMELTGGMCRWPMGEPTADMRYCGAKCVGSWCPRHRTLVWNSPGRRER